LAEAVDILVAEDNEVNQLYAGYAIEELKLSFEIAETGRVAVEKWRLLSPQIIFAVTAHAMKKDKQLCLDNDMDDYLPKPLTLDKLTECLKKWGV